MVGKCLSIFTALLLVLSFMPGSAAVYAQSSGTTLAVAQYTKAPGKVAEGSTATNATYSGTWEARVPMGKVMSAMENEMKSAAASGYYPHGKDGANTIAYVEYSVKFPEGAKIDASNITKSNSTTMFNTAAFKSEVSGQTVTFKFPLCDVNWAGIYQSYINDGGASSDKTIDFTIPYTVTAKSKAEAEAAEKAEITASGDFETHPSGRFYSFKKMVYNTDTSSLPLATDFSTAAIFGGTGGNTNPQDPDPQKPQDPKPSETAISLDADLLLGENTGNMPIEKKKDDVMSFVGTLDVKSIKDKMDEIKKLHDSAKSDKIAISELKSEFTATLELPEGLEFSGNKEAVFTGGNGVFAITKQTVEGKKASVTFALQKPEEIKNYTSLDEKIKSVDNTLKVTFRDVKFSESAEPDKDYEVIGKVTGSMEGTATYPDSISATDKKPALKMMLKNAMSLSAIEEAKPKTLKFAFQWNGKQSDAGKSTDNPNGIVIAVKYTEPEGILYGDLLVNNNTQHDKVYVAKKDDSLKMTGLLDVTPIKKTLKSLEAQYESSSKPDKIKVENIETSFTAIMTLPNELDFKDNFNGNQDVELTEANGKFKITKAELSSDRKTITVVMSLAKKATTFEDIKDAVYGVKDQLKVNVNGVKFNNKAIANTNYTIKGEISGNFSATATNETGKAINFIYNWTGVQLKGGEDSTAAPNSDDITLTLKYEPEGNLYGDLLVNNNTQHDKVYVAKKDDSLKMTGLLDVTPIKKTLKSLEAQYESSSKPDKIKVENIETSFTAIMTLPNELDFKDNFNGNQDVELTEANGKFKITKAELSSDRKTITVVMSLAKKATTFEDIKDAVYGVKDQLKVNVNGVKFNNKAIANTNYTIKGEISGNFSATATNETGKAINFIYNWTGVQLKGGEDSTAAPNSDDITLTLKYENETNPDTPENPTKPDNPNKPDNPVEPNNPEVTVPTENGDNPATTSPTKPSNVKPSATPNTADASDTTLYLVTVLISLAGVTVLEARRREER